MMQIWLLLAATAAGAEPFPYVEPVPGASLAARHTLQTASELYPQTDWRMHSLNGPSDIRLKRLFSPWGGKRAGLAWPWKRMPKVNLPKRVRFSPWGGKRSGPSVIRDQHIEESPHSFDAMHASEDVDAKREEKNSFWGGEKRNPEHKELLYHTADDILGMEKPKRKVKFSVWGGKRSEQSLDYPENEESYNEAYNILRMVKPKRKVKFSVWGGKRSIFDSLQALQHEEKNNILESYPYVKGYDLSDPSDGPFPGPARKLNI